MNCLELFLKFLVDLRRLLLCKRPSLVFLNTCNWPILHPKIGPVVYFCLLSLFCLVGSEMPRIFSVLIEPSTLSLLGKCSVSEHYFLSKTNPPKWPAPGNPEVKDVPLKHQGLKDSVYRGSTSSFPGSAFLENYADMDKKKLNLYLVLLCARPGFKYLHRPQFIFINHPLKLTPAFLSWQLRMQILVYQYYVLYRKGLLTDGNNSPNTVTFLVCLVKVGSWHAGQTLEYAI